jgi:hypothetical protein
MFKVWGKLISENEIKKSFDVENDTALSFEEKRDNAFEEICYHFDLSVPVWLDKHTKDFISFKRATFYPEDFVEELHYDRMEFDLIKWDDKI